MTTTETRFALVLNGGVSLAVWMGGVTHELNRLRLASLPAGAAPSDANELKVHKAWKEILDRTSRTAVIDAVAGTSAGGLNGTLLAMAVAGGKDLPYMRTTWSKVAALQEGKLLGDDGRPMQSMLNGKYFEDQVRLLLDGLAKSHEITQNRDCTLLVTSTAIDSEPATIMLEGAAQANVVDSRRVYRFVRRTDDRGHVHDDFADSWDDIALASRASASFPIAFEPVLESDSLDRFREAPAKESTRSWLIDGGVLDNAPFGPLMGALTARPVGAAFERVVLYVTPSPGSATQKPLGSGPTAKSVLGRVLGAAREPDQRLDFELMNDAFVQMGFTRSAPHDAIVRLLCDDEPSPVTRPSPGGAGRKSLPDQADGAIDRRCAPPDPGGPFIHVAGAREAAERWFETYRFSRAEAVERYLAGFDPETSFAPPLAPALDPDCLWSVPPAKLPLLPLPPRQWHWGLAAAERTVRWWGRALVDCKERNAALDATEAFEAVEKSQRLVGRMWRELEDHMQAGLPPDIERRADHLNAFYTAIPKEAGCSRDQEVRASIQAAAEAIAGLRTPHQVGAQDLIDFTLAIEVVSAALAWGSSSEGDAPRFRYRQVTPAARSVVDLGRTVKDPRWPSRKLYGERWGHFGAFASEKGRNADWLWGRLDGASALCDYLMTAPDGTPLVEDEREVERLRFALTKAILEAEGSNPEALRTAAAEAITAEPGDLLHHMSAVERRNAVRLLWRQATSLLEANGTAANGVTPVQLIRAFADPTWNKRDMSAGLGFKDRVTLRGVRVYGALARRIGGKKVRDALKI